jgi:LPS sulfotransferase NodH
MPESLVTNAKFVRFVTRQSPSNFGNMSLRKEARHRLAMARAYTASFKQSPEVRPFLIFTAGRNGSELLSALLDSHPSIVCDGELLSRRRLNVDRLIAGRIARTKSLGKSAFGFKIKPKDLHEIQRVGDPVEWVKSLADQGWLFIRLRRRDQLQQAISAIRGSKTRWHFRAGSVPSFEPMKIDPYVVIASMCNLAYYEAQIAELLKGLEHVTFTYEDDLREPTDQAATVGTICGHLGVPDGPTSSDFARVQPRETRLMVTNYDEIADVIRRNEFAQFLSDD